MSEVNEKIQQLTKDLKTTGLGKPKKQMNFEKVNIELKDDFKTGQITATIKMYKKDNDLPFNEMNDIQKMATIITWALTNQETIGMVYDRFAQAHSKSSEEASEAQYEEING